MNFKRMRLVDFCQEKVFFKSPDCFYCFDQKSKAVKAVEAEIEVNGVSQSLFFGICANHAEICPYPDGAWTNEEWTIF